MPAKRPAKAAKAARKPAKGSPAKRTGAVAARTGGAARPDKGEGEPAVRALFAAMPAWQRGVAQRIDAVVRREVPGAVRAVKWGAAFYGKPGGGWFASTKGFRKVVKLTFFQGASLKPVPPVGEHERGRGLAVAEGEAVDEAQVAGWVRQASELPGWGTA